jgi:hypothetical protein
MGNTITVWFDDPRKESIWEEIGDDVVLIKDQEGRVIGFERLNYLSPSHRGRGTNVPVEVHVL